MLRVDEPGDVIVALLQHNDEEPKVIGFSVYKVDLFPCFFSSLSHPADCSSMEKAKKIHWTEDFSEQQKLGTIPHTVTPGRLGFFQHFFRKSLFRDALDLTDLTDLVMARGGFRHGLEN